MLDLFENLPLRRVLAIVAAVAMLVWVVAAVAPVVVLACTPEQQQQGVCKGGDPPPPPPPPPPSSDPCLTQTHVNPECLDEDDDPDCNDIATHVPEECQTPGDEPGDQPGDGDGDQPGDGDDDSSTDRTTDSGPQPDLPFTGGSYLVYGVTGGVATLVAAANLMRGRRRWGSTTE